MPTLVCTLAQLLDLLNSIKLGAQVQCTGWLLEHKRLSPEQELNLCQLIAEATPTSSCWRLIQSWKGLRTRFAYYNGSISLCSMIQIVNFRPSAVEVLLARFKATVWTADYGLGKLLAKYCVQEVCWLGKSEHLQDLLKLYPDLPILSVANGRCLVLGPECQVQHLRVMSSGLRAGIILSLCPNLKKLSLDFGSDNLVNELERLERLFSEGVSTYPSGPDARKLEMDTCIEQTRARWPHVELYNIGPTSKLDTKLP